MKKMNILLGLLVCMLLAFTFSGCNKDESAQNYPYEVRMTDAPGPYDAVYVDVIGVEITGNDGKAVMMNVHAGIYNLLDFSNGFDTVIASGTMHVNTVQQIRLILGTNNTVVVNGVTYPLSTPSADQSGLKLQVHQTLQAGVVYRVLLDFDANQSIVDQGNGTYKLKPVIRNVDLVATGSIKGRITPAGTLAFVTATSNNVSYSSNVSATGEFQIFGLPVGTYSLTITPQLPLLFVTQNNISVTAGNTTDVGIIAF